MSEKYKKVLIVIGLFVLLLAASIVLAFGKRSFARYGNDYKNTKYEISGRRGIAYADYQKVNFITPLDALKTGEITAIVDYIDSIKVKVNEIALQNDGVIYETNISYLSNEVRNANIVLQIPAEKFEETFEALRSLGVNIVRESTRQIPPVTVYPSGAGSAESIKSTESQDVNEETEQSDVKDIEEGSRGSLNDEQATESQKAIYPQPQIKTQDKGYIRLTLTDYNERSIGGFSKTENRSRMMFFQNNSQDFSKSIWIAIGIKLALLGAMFCLLIFLSIRMVKSFFKHRVYKKNTVTKSSVKKAVVHVIRKTPKSRVVRKKI
ncbi:MAG: hypothetical protein ACD_5C00314G0001 [uncultured bacterium]|nr:MAG: hypothetical protein ACD_5C00314G0001 [uncultured bacterium]